MSSRFAKSSANREKPKRRLYGRKITRPPGKERAHAFEMLAPKLAIPVDLPDVQISPASLFQGKYKEHWLEIGFGNGEHLVALMDQNPGVAFIGAEPFMTGTAAFMQLLQKRHCERSEAIHTRHGGLPRRSTPRNDDFGNIRTYMDDVRLFVHVLTDQSIDRIYVLNPDPWPKKRHHKRRLIQQDTLSEFARILKPGGLLLMCTDVAALAEWMAIQATNHPAFAWTATSSKDWENPPEGWASTTRYREKGAKAGREMTYLVFKKLAKAG